MGKSMMTSAEPSPGAWHLTVVRADYVLRRVGGTPAGREIFDGLIKRFDNRYPQHKLLADLLTSSGHLEMGVDEFED